MKKCQEKFRQYPVGRIRSRKDLEPVKISLRKLLANGGMEHYLSLCSDRIAENEKIDGEDTQITLNLLFDGIDWKNLGKKIGEEMRKM